jgi:hypothetical protein
VPRSTARTPTIPRRPYEHAIEDYLLPGRGMVRVCYEAETAKGEDGKEYVAKQELYEEYVPGTTSGTSRRRPGTR